MLVEKQQERLLKKIQRFEKMLEALIFKKEYSLDFQMYHTTENLHAIPDESLFKPCKPHDRWSQEKTYCWFKGSFEVPARLAGEDLFLMPKIGGYEAMLWVDGHPSGIFTSKININSHGNHYCDLLYKNVKSEQKIDIALEYYAHHDFPGVKPLEIESQGNFDYEYRGVDVCTKNHQVAEYYFDLKTILQLYSVQEETSFIKADLTNLFFSLHEKLYYDLDQLSEVQLSEMLSETQPLLKKVLNKTNGSSAPSAGIIGHSHMDTAWLWTKDETIKKCARTYANQLSLMKQYPEYKFIQSSAYHTELVRRYYPDLYEDIKTEILNGRYEPNGGVWVESDCNLPSGEYLIRQFVLGQKYTKNNFNYLSDTFWLPDTFGYSAALPQIMKQCGINYFLTTKLDWNDTNTFPYDTFKWEGIDGTSVFAHFNRTHIWPDAKDVYKYVCTQKSGLKEKSVADTRLLSYGYGDGGGGPQFEMIELARRITDLEGIPKTEHTTVSAFMKKLEQAVVEPTTYVGELYLELHRGTLTNKHEIKRNNRLAEISLHDLEYLEIRKSLEENRCPSSEKIRPLMETLLVNQFHDILPGTCIEAAHKQSLKETTQLIKNANKQIQQKFSDSNKEDNLTIHNTLSCQRSDTFYLDVDEEIKYEGVNQQSFIDLYGNNKLAVDGVSIPALASVQIKKAVATNDSDKELSEFTMKDNKLLTPFYQVEFDERKYITSLIERESKRELHGGGLPLNTFIIAEDVPVSWDNWDIDADLMYKFKDRAQLIETSVVADGSVEFRLRQKYRLTEKSTLSQDIIFFANHKEIRFETLIDWQDDHYFLKTAFETSIQTDFARFETQFGNLKRPTIKNTSVDKARFEVTNQKYTDISEENYGIALLNDCKYGISVEKGMMYLSLHKGGNRPDPSGDRGLHYCNYSLLPHAERFSAESVILPAYRFNYHHRVVDQGKALASLVEIDQPNIIIETIKPLETEENGYLLRVYEAEGSWTRCKLEVKEAASLTLTNMLERPIQEKIKHELTFRPFEIKNIKVLM